MNNKIIPFYEYKTDVIQAFSSYGLETAFPPHLHACPELYRVNAGALKVLLGTQEYLVTEGHLLVVFPNVIHAYESTDPLTEMDLIICGPDPNNGYPQKTSNYILEEPILPISQLHPDVDYMFSALLEEAQKDKNTQLINAYFQIFWRRLLPDLTFADATQPTVPDLVTNLIVYITEHFCEPLSLESLSKELGVCRFYLSRIFTQVLHISFCKYVNTLRINHAKKLLLNNQNKILDIAIECGFQSQQTFNRVFKEICGITPVTYRKIFIDK